MIFNCEPNITMPNYPKLTINAWSLDHSSHCEYYRLLEQFFRQSDLKQNHQLPWPGIFQTLDRICNHGNFGLLEHRKNCRCLGNIFQYYRSNGILHNQTKVEETNIDEIDELDKDDECILIWFRGVIGWRAECNSIFVLIQNCYNLTFSLKINIWFESGICYRV